MLNQHLWRQDVTHRLWFALVGICLAGAAQAQGVNACIDRCFSNFSPSQNNGSTELRDECLEQCKAPSAAYGAIAYGAKSTANGYAFGKASAADAQRTAMDNCRQHGDDCKIVVNFLNRCAAVAAVESKGRFSTGQGLTRAEAQNNAMKACQSQVGGACAIEVWSCALP